MKITKHTSITSSKQETNELVLDDAANYIQSAINSLTSVVRKAENDESLSEKASIAQDCIVDLSTVLLTLKG